MACVEVTPGRMGGAPCLGGTRIPTDQIAGLVWDCGMEQVRRGWTYLTDEQILVACWYEVTHGNRRYWRRHFADWPAEYREAEWRARPDVTWMTA